ncbi:DUF421 domain-containing protein [Sporosarcina thermotolerans]|uniref:DUF421 domain-containing protein n=1 Tax=Sporosarcina thermotolerans TaxID=633404 RepID=A0AAW9A8W5_9BACL|nr:DUF421 domain-containing protein [Sporosarcina thermotolerans]MDW0118081.1 DUF421 domain-containing protein [Sporosarcina thermotolerans]
MSDLVIIGARTVFLYVLVLIILRVMGKREVGELSVIDVVVFVIIAEVVAIALESPENKLSHTILPMLILLGIQLLTSYISLKSKKFRDLVDGDPTVIIENGVILEKEMRKQRYNMDDLFQQLREQQIGSVREVSYAYLEPSGNLSVFKYDQTQPVLALISDGVIQSSHLQIIGKSKGWLVDELQKQGVNDVKQVFYCSFEDGRLHLQLKEEYQ